ncbi:hypothetical protein DVR12_03190 [Chitinophaga silvatica]|uniref:Uncharacterized protein n=1 Tax=Chitinophaga silvatica TaxID=2282649 RepID=A0A3E1YH98_9BACT|nr:hypothetical protein [Chitinophaga silvatica]RFS26805.1 hypothetical protein DVR12_03190 [Chitinophaga silvatica]
MSKTTNSALIEGLQKLLKNRGSMTVEGVDLLERVIDHLREYEKLKKKDDRMQRAAVIVELLLKFLLLPSVSEKIGDTLNNLPHTISNLIDKLL